MDLPIKLNDKEARIIMQALFHFRWKELSGKKKLEDQSIKNLISLEFKIRNGLKALSKSYEPNRKN